MAAFPESADTLYAGELEIGLGEGLVLASGRAPGAPNAGPGFSTSMSPHAARACAATAVPDSADIRSRGGAPEAACPLPIRRLRQC
jgi:hypothetical protein